MIQRVLEQQAPICATLMEVRRLDLLPTDDEFELLEEVVHVLKPFKDVTVQMSASQYMTISAICPILHHLLHTVLKENDSDSAAVRRMKVVMSSNLSSCYQDPYVKHFLNTACFVDPRLKDFLPKRYTEEALDIDSKLLSWWKSNQKRFPSIASVAKIYLCVPAISSPFERLFSTTGIVVSSKRALLNPDNMNMLGSLAENMN